MGTLSRSNRVDRDLGSRALEKMLGTLIGSTGLADAETRWGESFRVRLFRHAVGLGRLRWLKHRERPKLSDLCFRKISGKNSHPKYEKAMGNGWNPDFIAAVRQILEFSSAQWLQDSWDFVGACQALPEAPEAQLCNGHDLIGFLAAGCGALGQRESVEDWTRILYLACERIWLESTAMWAGLRLWEADHPGFQILSPAP